MLQKRSADRYKELVENVNDAVYTVEFKTLEFTSVNQAAERLTGYTKHALLHKKVFEIIPKEYIPIVQKMIGLKHKKKSTVYEIEIIRKDGTLVPVEISSTALYDNDIPVEILGVARDISSRKLLEKQRSIFISLITHEVKNPLTSALLYLPLLQKRVQKDDTSLHYVETLQRQMISIDRLMTDFLDVMQMRVGKFRLHRERIDVNEIIDEVINQFSPTNRVIRKEGSAKKVFADATRIKQVLTNLISNAVKYSRDEEEILIQVTNNVSHVVIGVKDFGEGIAKEDQSKIFHVFERTDVVLKKTIKGHGLGLYICREIVKHHGGKLWVESTLGKGSTFFFTIPYKV